MKATAALLSLLVLAPTLSASVETPTTISARAKGASHVVVATVVDVQSRFDVNQFGDQLIVSDLELEVEETVKGAHARSRTVTVEGGTVGEITLDVSDMPRMTKGDRAVWFLREKPNGGHSPAGRGAGILGLETNGRVKGSPDLTLDEVKRRVKEAR